jgi:hypothetical protein
MTTAVQGPNTQTSATPGTSVIAILQNVAGGYIVNPLTAADQGLAATEALYVNQVTTADTHANNTTIALQPGQSYTVVPNTTTPVQVASLSASHKFTAVQWT